MGQFIQSANQAPRNPATNATPRPIRVCPNPVPVYYEGGHAIALFRGLKEFPSPEDWVGSLVTFPPHLVPPGLHGTFGISPTEHGALTDIVFADTKNWLGSGQMPEDYALLVKLLDAGERLPAHWHPSREFARQYLESAFGKAEAWVVLSEGTSDLWLGLAPGVGPEQVAEAIAAQEPDGFLALMNRTSVTRGDVIFVPPGIMHALGIGAFVVELQEPTTLSVLAEFERVGVQSEYAALGLGWPLVQASLNFDPAANDPDRLVQRGRALADGATNFLPPDADCYFHCTSVRRAVGVRVGIEAMTVLIAVEGKIEFDAGSGPQEAKAGEIWVIPASSGSVIVSATGQALLCQPASER